MLALLIAFISGVLDGGYACMFPNILQVDFDVLVSCLAFSDHSRDTSCRWRPKYKNLIRVSVLQDLTKVETPVSSESWLDESRKARPNSGIRSRQFSGFCPAFALVAHAFLRVMGGSLLIFFPFFFPSCLLRNVSSPCACLWCPS
ncbi:hypothetical protein BD289DRAFT_264436 [Coniella lustricola]|uniref:Secreted protein n=1 Tax=Coniella lustricola TaxID=2025994 RepID=A0A2T3A7F3_9PEZI|nr:hypothetical protein BD289DRAFT_264436 [Coniella lustricola]